MATDQDASTPLLARLGELDADALERAYPWPERRWVRANMVMSLDGASVGPDGLSRSLSSPGDQTVFRSLRAFADCVLVGAGTIRAERYTPMRPAAALQEARRARGLAAAPRLAVVSGSLDLPWAEPMFAESTLTPLVLTGTAASSERLELARTHAEVMVLPGLRLDPAALLAALEERGQRRILCEGGASLLADLVAFDLLDEADVTTAPVFVGSAATPRTPLLASVSRFDLTGVIGDEGYLMSRYVRSGR